MQVHEKNLLGLWCSPGPDARKICERYWERGQNAPIVATFGGDPLLFLFTQSKLDWCRSEMDFVGGVRGHGIEMIRGPLTGLPIPAHAEIAIEGEVPPPSVESRKARSANGVQGDEARVDGSRGPDFDAHAPAYQSSRSRWPADQVYMNQFVKK
jgi:hypothetical protein